MAEDERTRRWQRISTPTDADPIQALRSAIAAIRATPADPEARRRLRALAAEQGMWEQLALLLADEARAAASRNDVAAAFLEELADVHDNLDQSLEQIAAMEDLVTLVPGDVEHHDRLGRLYHREGAWNKAAESFERVAALAVDDRARAALRAAGRIYREHGRLDRAAQVFRAIVERRPSDVDAWRAIEDIAEKLGQWHDVAEARGELAARAQAGVDKAVLLRGQARALEQAGDATAAAALVAKAAVHAPDDVSGLVDYATVLARGGKGVEAADVLRERIAEAIERGAPDHDIAALRSRLAGILEDACGDRVASAAVLAELLADAPDYLPALERLVWQASHDADPRAHATALLRHAAALPDGPDKIAGVLEAARKLRGTGDARAALRAFEKASELAPTDPAIGRELDDARTVVAVERAAAEAKGGDVGAAVRRLRAILDAHPTNLAANLALVELLPPGDAAEHLRATLAAAPDDAPVAALVHRYALVVAAQGEADEAHQLLHEAHHLDRKDLVITLALGESCFARRLWREAALHLGSLADHPDAPNHASEVAAGLVHAALAEVRALRPANAGKRYEAAARLDPGCARAWHGLAEAAIERGEMANAADFLEKEAAATSEPRDRRRLYDALGDLAQDVLGDALRAERCWVLADGDAKVLGKLLAVQRKRGAGRERGETCERLAELTDDKRAIKELAEEAAQAYAAGGDLVRARATASRLVAAHPLDVDAVDTASRVALDAGDFAAAATWLKRGLATWDRGDGDPRRADLWRRLGDAERGRGDGKAALVAYQRAVVVAPDSDGALAARRGLVELATTAGRPAGASLAALVEADPEPNDALAWARELAAALNPADARVAFELARALGARLDADDERFLAAHPPRAMASDEAYVPLDEAERRALVDDEADAPLADVLDLLGEVAHLVAPDAKAALELAGLGDARRMSAASDAATAAVYPQIANALCGPQTLLYATARGPDLTLLLAAPPVVVVGPRLASLRAKSVGDAELAGDAALRFELGRVVELARPRRVFSVDDNFPQLIAGLVEAFGKPTGEPGAAREADRLRQAIPMLVRRRIAERLAAATASIDVHEYVAGCQRAADRSGLLACGHVGIAIELAGGRDARHLARMAASPRYLAARRKLRRSHRS